MANILASLGKLNGNLTGPSAAVIAVVLILSNAGIIGGSGNLTAEQVRELAAFQQRVTWEHEAHTEALKELAAEIKTISEINRETLMIAKGIESKVEHP